MDSERTPSQLAISLLSYASAIAHPILLLTVPFSSHFENLIHLNTTATTATSTSLTTATILNISTYSSSLFLLWVSNQPYSSFFSVHPSKFQKKKKKKKKKASSKPGGQPTEIVWPGRPGPQEKARFTTVNHVAFAATLVLGVDVVRLWLRALVTAFESVYATGDPRRSMGIVEHIVFGPMVVWLSIFAVLAICLLLGAMGNVWKIGDEAGVECCKRNVANNAGTGRRGYKT